MAEYILTKKDIIDIYRRYVMRCPTRKVRRYTGQVDDVPKDNYEIENAARTWFFNFKNRVK